MASPPATSVYLQMSPSDGCWEVKGDNFSEDPIQSNGKDASPPANSSRPRRQATRAGAVPPPKDPTCQPPADPNDFYVEETANAYHNPPFPTKEGGGVPPDELRHIPPPPPVPPDLPNTGHCCWSWDEQSRVLLADFSSSTTIDFIDEKSFSK